MRIKLLHKTGGRRNPNWKWDCIFCESTKFWGQTTLVLGLLKLEISLSFDKKYFGIIQGFQRQRSMIYYLQVDDDLLTFSYFHFLYI